MKAGYGRSAFPSTQLDIKAQGGLLSKAEHQSSENWELELVQHPGKNWLGSVSTNKLISFLTNSCMCPFSPQHIYTIILLHWLIFVDLKKKTLWCARDTGYATYILTGKNMKIDFLYLLWFSAHLRRTLLSLVF